MVALIGLERGPVGKLVVRLQGQRLAVEADHRRALGAGFDHVGQVSVLEPAEPALGDLGVGEGAGDGVVIHGFSRIYRPK